LLRGCVTPKQISNLVEFIGESKDLSQIDGYDELSPEYQAKVRDAIEHGHVDDADWRGVSRDVSFDL
jgi:hypothetical protein